MFNKNIQLFSGLTLLGLAYTVDSYAAFTHSGTVSALGGESASASTAYAENWSWAQISGLVNASVCNTGDEGSGDLAYLAYPSSETHIGSMLLSAYLSGQSVSATVDDANLYEGNCRLTRVVLTPGEPTTPSAPAILSYDFPDLIAAYSFDNDYSDLSGNAQNLNNSGGQLVAGLSNNAVEITVGDVLTAAGAVIPATGDFTIALWFKPETWPFAPSTSSVGSVLNQYTGGGSGRLDIKLADNGGVYFQFGDVSASVSPSTVSAGDYSLLIAERSGASISLSVNVSEVGTASPDASDAVPNTAMAIGKEAVNNTYFSGDIDSVRIFNRILTASEKADLLSEKP